MSKFNNFKNNTLKAIKVWAWLAAVLPMTAIVGIFSIWLFGTKELFDWAMIVGQTLMFTVAVVWWWWALYIIKRLVYQWESARLNVSQVLDDLREVKEIFRENFRPPADK